MKGTKEQKGITLIALIITIVVLLILAAVAISSIQNDGILHYAQNAADSWDKAQTNEQATLDSYLAYLDNLKYQQCPGHTYSSETGLCTNCGYECQHKWPYSTFGVVACENCGYVCEHEGERTAPTYYSNGNGTHTEWNYCALCGGDEGTPGEEIDCSYGDDNLCDLCGSKYDCSTNGHVYGDDYVCDMCKGLYDCSADGHKWNGDSVCDICGSECVSHQWDEENPGKCLVCSYQCEHESTYTEYYYTGDGEQHDCVDCCNHCNWYSTESNLEDCEIDENGCCTKCPYRILGKY